MVKLIELYAQDESVLASWNLDDFGSENSISIGTGKNVRISFDPEAPEIFLAALIREDDQWSVASAEEKYPILMENESIFHAPLKPGLRYRIGDWTFALNSGEKTEESNFSLLCRNQDKTANCYNLKAGTTSVIQTADGKFRVNTQGRTLFEVHTDGQKTFHLVSTELDANSEKKIRTLSVQPGEQFSYGSFTGLILSSEDTKKAMRGKDPMAYPTQEIRHKLRLYFTMALLCLILAMLLQVIADRKEKYLHKKYNICQELAVAEIQIPAGSTLEQTVQKLRDVGRYEEAEQLCAKFPESDPALRKAVAAEKEIYLPYLIADDKYFRFLADVLRFEDASGKVEAVGLELKNKIDSLQAQVDVPLQYLQERIPAENRKDSRMFQNLLRMKQVLTDHEQYISMVFKIRELVEQEKWTELQKHLEQVDRQSFTFFSRQKVYDDAKELANFHLVKVPALYKDIVLKDLAAYQTKNITELHRKLDDALKGLEDNVFFPYELAVRNKNLELKRMQVIADFAKQLKEIREKDFSEKDVQDLLTALRLVKKYSNPDMVYTVEFIAHCRQEIISYILQKFKELEKRPPRPVFADTADAMVIALEQLDETAEVANLKRFARKINQQFNGIWNQLHTDYKVALANGNKAAAATVLKKMLDMGPCDNKYYQWAVQEQKKVQENKK